MSRAGRSERGRGLAGVAVRPPRFGAAVVERVGCPIPHLAGVRVAATLAVVAGLATALCTVWIVYRLHVPLPYWDEWYSIPHFRKFAAGEYGLADLATQHNEHRLLVPRLFFFADEALFGLSGVLDATVTLALQMVNALVLGALILRSAARPAHRALLAGFVLLTLFTLRQEQNFCNGFQLQFVGVFTAALLAAVAYATALDRLRRGWAAGAPFFALAALGCAVSAYTMANGILAGAVLAAAALLCRSPWPVPAATAALTAALAALFFHRYVPGGLTYGAAEAWSHAWAYPRFLTAYLGDPLGSNIRAAQALGVAGLLLMAGAAWRVATDRARSPASLALFILAAFVVTTGAATTYGRIAGGTQQALESRYATPSLLFWCAMAIFWWPVAVRAAAPALALGSLMALVAAASCWFEATAWPDLAARSAALRRVSDSLLAGLYDEATAEGYETTEAFRIASFVPFLRAHRLAAFGDPAFAALGRPIGAPSPHGRCDGSVVAAADPALGPGGVRLSGRATDGTLHRAPRRVFLADAEGTVVGFGSASLPGEPSRQWTGYARAAEGGMLRAYVQLGDGTPCDIGSATVGPADAR